MRRRLLWLIIWGWLLAVSWLRPAALDVLDVGQGLAVLFTDSTGWQLLYDGGPGNAVLPALAATLPATDRVIDVIVLSHTHRDHLEGLIEVLKRYQVKEVWWSGAAGNDDVFTTWETAVEQSGARVTIITTGWRRQLASGWTITALHPDHLETGTHAHDHGVVLQLYNDEQTILFTGDLEASNERDVLERCQTSIVIRCRPPLAILQVSHHGSRTSTADDWLDYWQPRLAVIGVGEKNPYNHPHQETLDRLAAHQIPYFRTDHDSSIHYDLNSLDQNHNNS